MAPWLLPYLVDRPLNLHRFPDGVERKGFWQKQAPRHAPDWIERWNNPEADEGESRDYLVVAEMPALVWLANHAALELHPWTSRRPDVHRPTYALVDLDPGEATRWDDLLTLARLHRTALEHLGVRGYAKTSGQRGLQIWIPLEPGPTFDETREWVRQLSRAVAGVVGDLVSDKWETKARDGRARLDYTQNAINKTLVAPYSVRAGSRRAGLDAHRVGRSRRSRPSIRPLGSREHTGVGRGARRSPGADAHRRAASRAPGLTHLTQIFPRPRLTPWSC